ncbi:ABC transporter substrate-binding protein [Pantoea sp. Mb-10]|uniref:ABC transporter substrate-binding protein n=1 Tax=unclassified Pantoea TaxID=2630326 RepID=UPI001E4BD2AB|nr:MULTISPECIES: ABC transporter substrate-binding protein [unclassified Pantoea]MCE0490432.1 ABC transporter substrate-binding protein [Pantoea sp. Mb-10]MCE0501563.1 ABC transporter substrate-binding protein [Pantoea sp. Pb-8]
MRLWILLVALCSSVLTAQAATPKDTLVVAVPLDGIISFDPAESFETVSNSVQRNLYQTLVEADRNTPQRLAPLLASAWRPGSSPHSLVFTLNPAARFVSGNPVTAQDVIFSLTRAVKLNKAPAFILAEFGWTADNIAAQFTAHSDTELEIRWPAAIGADLALRLLSAPVASVVDSQTVQQHAVNNDLGNGWLHTQSAGSGAFRIQQYVPQQALVLSANPHATPQPHLTRILLKGVADAATRRLLIQQGDVDIAYQLGPDQIDALKQDSRVRIAAFPSSLIYYLGFNTQSQAQPALGNPAFWHAARWLVNYQAISQQLLKGQYQIHQSFLPQGFDGALRDQPFHYDVEKAKTLLAAGGIKPGTRVVLTVVNQPPYSDIAQALQAGFAQAGIDIVLQPVAESELWSKMRGRDFQAILSYWGADYVDPNSNASAFALNVPGGAKTLAWRVGWSIPELSAKTRAAAGESDAAARRALYGELQKTIQHDSPFVVMLQGAQQVAIRSNVSHVQQGIGVSLLFFDAVEKH